MATCSRLEVQHMLKRLWYNVKAVTAVEYSIIACVIALACMTALSSVGLALSAVFAKIAGQL